MPKTTVYNMAGEAVGEIELSDAIFGIEPNKAVLHESVKNHLANMRQGTQSALTRAEVSGGGRKPFRQKGTGRARQGSTRAIQWTHGGVAFAPKPRDYSYRLNKKIKRLAIKSALSEKFLKNEIKIVDDISMPDIKTKDFVKFLGAMNVTGKALVVTPEPRETVIKSSRNIEGVRTTTSTILCPYDIMNCGSLIVDKSAISKIEEVFA